jgi:hypothetical protein
MDPTTLIALWMFMKKRGRGSDDMFPLLLLLASSGQSLFGGGSALVPVLPATGLPGAPAPIAGPNNSLLLMALLMGGEGGGFGDFFRHRRKAEEGEVAPESRQP